MSAKAGLFVVFAQALLIQSALSQCIGRTIGTAPALAAPYAAPTLTYDSVPTGWAGNSLAYTGLVTLAPAVDISPTNGGALPVSSASFIAPTGIAVASENAYEGTLAVDGELPFVGTVAMEGVMPSAGVGAVNYACGNGATRMVSQNSAAVSAGIASGFGFGIAPAAFAPGSLYGQGIGAFSPAAFSLIPASPFGYHAGLADLGNSIALAGGYPATGFACAYPAATYGPGAAAYGGAGEGNVAVAGELPVTGNTAVAGQVPIMGSVRFNGAIPAAGTVSISGRCGCGYGIPYLY